MNTEAQMGRTRRASTIGPARQAARALVASYVHPVAQWNVDLALLRQMAESPRLPAAERRAVHDRLLAMQTEVRHAHRAFAAAIAEHPPHSIIDDLENSYRRLQAQVAAAVENVGVA